VKSPAFQFYPDDFLGSGKVGTMTVDEVGAYTLLLCLDWNEGGFAFDEEELARWCRVSRQKFRKMWVRISRCFDAHDGRMFNARLQKEREKQAEWREKSAKGGRASAQAKAKGGSTTLEPPSSPNGNTPSPSPTPVTTQEPKGADRPRVQKAKGEAAPWMGIMRTAWSIGTLPIGSAKLLSPVVGEVGADECASRLANYCEQADPEWASVRNFVTRHAHYATVGRLAVDPETGLPNAIGIAALSGRRA
jgi:uncharacterized protein YdaU (DUF1376 family)